MKTRLAACEKGWKTKSCPCRAGRNPKPAALDEIASRPAVAVLRLLWLGKRYPLVPSGLGLLPATAFDSLVEDGGVGIAEVHILAYGVLLAGGGDIFYGFEE